MSDCHTRSAKRVLRAMLANGGEFYIFQIRVLFFSTVSKRDIHQDGTNYGFSVSYLRLLSSTSNLYIGRAMLPKEWTDVMRVLQDQCDPTPYEDLERLFITDMGQDIHEIFDDFDPSPIGVASLAQVHVGRYKQTGQLVAVKVSQSVVPHDSISRRRIFSCNTLTLQSFLKLTWRRSRWRWVCVSPSPARQPLISHISGWVKHWFPEFEFTWLGEEMRENLPKEMDFAHEARNAEKAVGDFKGVRTSLYIPEVLFSSKRVLVMEYIQGGRVDDLEYLDAHSIDRNKVAIELSSIFSRMVHLSGWFHADPHPGKVAVR